MGILVVAPSDGCPATAPRLALAQALRSRCVSSASKLLDAPGSHLRPPSLQSWFCGSTKKPDGFLVNLRKPCVQTPVVSHYPASAHVHDFVLLFFPPCGRLAFLATMQPTLDPAGHRVTRAEPTYLSTPRRPCKVKTFRACSSPAPTQIKPQPEPTILGNESVHTTLSLTHHSQERPSTGPRTLRSSICPPMPPRLCRLVILRSLVLAKK
jgi:hypothetical protein